MRPPSIGISSLRLGLNWLRPSSRVSIRSRVPPHSCQHIPFFPFWALSRTPGYPFRVLRRSQRSRSPSPASPVPRVPVTRSALWRRPRGPSLRRIRQCIRGAFGPRGVRRCRFWLLSTRSLRPVPNSLPSRRPRRGYSFNVYGGFCSSAPPGRPFFQLFPLGCPPQLFDPVTFALRRRPHYANVYGAATSFRSSLCCLPFRLDASGLALAPRVQCLHEPNPPMYTGVSLPYYAVSRFDPVIAVYAALLQRIQPVADGVLHAPLLPLMPLTGTGAAQELLLCHTCSCREQTQSLPAGKNQGGATSTGWSLTLLSGVWYGGIGAGAAPAPVSGVPLCCNGFNRGTCTCHAHAPVVIQHASAPGGPQRRHFQ